MKTNGRKSPMDKIFLLLVSVATLIIMTTALNVTDVVNPEHQKPNQMEGKILGNETWKNGSIDVEIDSGDLAFEREQTKHKLILTGEVDSYSSGRYVECRGENVTSISATSCDTMDICEEHKSCLLNPEKCASVVVRHGEKCARYQDSLYGSSSDDDFNGSSSPSSSSCFRLGISRYSRDSGIIQCTSEENGGNVTTFDHYTIGYSEAKLLSTIQNVTSDLIQMKLYVSSIAHNLIDNATTLAGNLSLYVDEEVTSLECEVPKLLFTKEGLTIRVHRKDGSTVKLGPEMTSARDLGVTLTAELTGFLVTADIVAFSCAAQKTNSSGQWLEKRINFTVRDIPSEVLVRSSDCRNLTLNFTSGAKVNVHCELTGPSKHKTSVESYMREMDENYNFNKDLASESMVEFVRFYQVAGEHLNCQTLSQDMENASWKTQHEEYYGEDQRFHFTFNFAPSAPKIHKRLIRNNPSSTISVIYQEHLEQTLLCLFTGEPEPGITWMKNGQELFFTKSMGTRQMPGKNETMEHVKLPLNPKVIQPSDFDHSENGLVNFSCIARNHFGSDRLDFVITMSEKFRDQAENPTETTTNSPKPTEKSTTTTTEKSKVFLSSAITKSTSTTNPTPTSFTFQPTPTETGNSNSKLTAKKSSSKPKSILTISLTVFFFAFSVLLALMGFALWKKRKNGGSFVGSGRMFRFQRFQNSNENDEN